MLEMYPHHIPPDMGEKVKALCFEFIWGNKTWRVAHRTLTLRKEHRGIQLQDFETLAKTKNILWILKIMNRPLDKWNCIARHY